MRPRELGFHHEKIKGGEVNFDPKGNTKALNRVLMLISSNQGQKELLTCLCFEKRSFQIGLSKSCVFHVIEFSGLTKLHC